jgi:hypothetical protein
MEALDRAAIAYLCAPLAIFLAGWYEPWAAVPLLLCVAYSLKASIAPAPMPAPTIPNRPSVSRFGLGVALLVGAAWTVCGGTGHWVFANADWTVRDAVLHDLVVGSWPVGYGRLGGFESLLRAPIGYYLPAALVGKWCGLGAAHVAMALWTWMGVSLFLLQVLSRLPPRAEVALLAAALIVGFSGLDIVGDFLHVPQSGPHWDMTRHLEWWAQHYQYSSMTTQLFWVPNHALAGWLGIGLLWRHRRDVLLTPTLPILTVAVALWSPLAALGLLPFVIWNGYRAMEHERSARLLHPAVWGPALVVGLAVATYLTLDSSRIPRGWAEATHGGSAAAILEFFLLEAGLIGFAVLWIRRSGEVAIALAVLAVLPLVRFGAANDLVMRASIPSLAVLAIGACFALFDRPGAIPKKVLLIGLLALGAVTPFQEFARAAVLAPWPIDGESSLIDAACGVPPAHYVARLDGQAVTHILRSPRPLAGASARHCDNPALDHLRDHTRAMAAP